jgi:hypothetical protein
MEIEPHAGSRSLARGVSLLWTCDKFHMTSVQEFSIIETVVDKRLCRITLYNMMSSHILQQML